MTDTHYRSPVMSGVVYLQSEEVLGSNDFLILSFVCFTVPIQIMTDNKLSSSQVGY